MTHAEAQPVLFPLPERRALPRFARRPAWRIVMHAAGQEWYITTYHGSANRAARYAAKLEARTGRRHEAREVGA